MNYFDPNDRKYWVAGTKVIVIDTQTGELLAEKIWYAFDRRQGSRANARTPWQKAITCPYDGYSRTATADFVKNVIKPKQGK